MIELDPRSASPIARFGGQPIAIAAVALAIVVLGIGSIALWRAYTGTAPETDRAVVVRQLQARTAQASEQLVEKTKGLEATQQESIDQLQVVQDQLQTVRRLLASQQTDTKKLSEQVGTLTEAIDGLRQSFASTRASEAAADSAPRKRSAKAKPRSESQPKRGKSQASRATPRAVGLIDRIPKARFGVLPALTAATGRGSVAAGRRRLEAGPPPHRRGFANFSPPNVNWFTYARENPGHAAVHRMA